MSDTNPVLESIERSVTEFKRKHQSELADVRRIAESARKAAEDATARAARAAIYGGQGDLGADREAKEHLDAFVAVIRDPRNHTKRAALAEIESKAVYTSGTGGDAAGGYAVPTIIAAEVHRQLQEVSPIRSIARVVSVQSSDFKLLVDTRGETAGWAGENGARSETATPQLAEVAPTFGTLYAYPTASEESIADIGFDVGRWLTDNLVDTFARVEGAAFVVGDGSNKPTGFMQATKVASNPTFGQLRYVATGMAGDFATLSTTSPVRSPADVLIQAVHAVPASYRRLGRCVWLMNGRTLAEVRQFKDANGRYLIDTARPDELLGFRIVEAEDMPDVGSNAYPIAFGDFQAGYLIADQGTLRVTVDEITTPGKVKFHVRKRLGGKLLDSRALALVKCAAS